MSSDEGRGYAFVCPGCETSIAVDEPMKAELLERGCVICETAVTAAAFTPMPRIETRDGG